MKVKSKHNKGDRLNEKSMLRYVSESPSIITNSGKKKRMAIFICDCGELVVKNFSLVKLGKTKSCGCLKFASPESVKHGYYGTTEYKSWAAMHQRCGNPNDNGFKWYGARGIKVCAEWNEFKKFIADMGDKPSHKHHIDRIDNNGNYCEENCRWATPKQNQNNKSTSKYWFVNGVKFSTASEASLATGYSRSQVSRMCLGRKPEKKKKSMTKNYPPKPNCWVEMKYQTHEVIEP